MLLPLFWEALLNASLGAICTIGTSQVVFLYIVLALSAKYNSATRAEYTRVHWN